MSNKVKKSNFNIMIEKEFKKMVDELISSGYVCCGEGHKDGEYYYEKTFLDDNGNEKYQILILVYAYSEIKSILNPFIIWYECSLLGELGLKMRVSEDDLDLLKFEERSESFYERFKKYNL